MPEQGQGTAFCTGWSLAIALAGASGPGPQPLLGPLDLLLLLVLCSGVPWGSQLFLQVIVCPCQLPPLLEANQPSASVALWGASLEELGRPFNTPSCPFLAQYNVPPSCCWPRGCEHVLYLPPSVIHVTFPPFINPSHLVWMAIHEAPSLPQHALPSHCPLMGRDRARLAANAKPAPSRLDEDQVCPPHRCLQVELDVEKAGRELGLVWW